MATAPTLISVEEYLRTSYRPDRDYVDGEVQERSLGETPHTRLQKLLLRWLEDREKQWRVEAMQEQRLQINDTRYRIPDLLLAARPNRDRLIIRTPPLLCIEVLSSSDRMRSVQERVDDYAALGVRATWVVDPWRELAYMAGADGVLRQEGDRLVVPGSEIALSVAEMFSELARRTAEAESE